MRLEGEVLDVKFRNLENCYTVVMVDTGLAPVFCVGAFPDINPGEQLVMEGEYKYNQKYGEQFEVSSVIVKFPATITSMIQFLSSGIFPGIKLTIATRIVETFKDKTFEVLASDPKALSTVKGISIKKAKEIVEKFVSLSDMRDLIMYLQAFDITVSMATKLYMAYGNQTRAILEQNPYKIIEDIDGIGFKTADAIAVKMGIPLNSSERVIAAITYILTEVANQKGHTYLFYDDLVSETISLLTLNPQEHIDLVETSISTCERLGRIILFEKFERKVVMSYILYHKEKEIAKKLIQLMNATSNNIPVDIDENIKEYQQIHKIALDEKQIEAIKNSLMYGVSVVTGGPGTGKTTIIKAIISMLNKLGKSYKLCAPTGRAAKRLSESTGMPSSTIHRALHLALNDETSKFVYNETEDLDEDVIIVDEVSMCDVFVMHSLLLALKKDARVIFVGDKDQLPSVGAGNVLSDMISSQVIPVSYLSRIYRQGEKSMISYNAHEINNGKMIALDNKSTDFFFQSADIPQTALDIVVDMVNNRLPKYFNVSVDEIQVLAPSKKGIVGIDNINKVLQDAINPIGPDGIQIQYGANNFRVGDRIIHIKNDYELTYSNLTGKSGTGVFNGEMGKIIDINPELPTITVQFDDEKLAIYGRKEFEEIQLAYAVTVHKSQGSEFKIVVFVAEENNPMLATRNLLYTGITRGKQAVVIVGKKDIIAKMIRNNRIDKRNSMLAAFLRDEAEFNF